MEKEIEQINKACVMANPDRWENPDNYELHEYGWKIRIADVLLAICAAGWNPEISINSDGRLHIFTLNRGTIYWNLRTDTIEEQSEECITGLSKLLAQ